MYIKSDLNDTVIEKSSEDAFQALWIEIHLSNRPNIICVIMYRQLNTPERFQEYFDETLEKFSTSNKSIFVMGDFNFSNSLIIHAALTQPEHLILVRWMSLEIQ